MLRCSSWVTNYFNLFISEVQYSFKLTVLFFFQRKDARIIIGSFYEERARHVFCEVLHIFLYLFSCLCFLFAFLICHLAQASKYYLFYPLLDFLCVCALKSYSHLFQVRGKRLFYDGKIEYLYLTGL